MASEQDVQQRIRLALSKGPVRLFRNNVGTGWVGPVTNVTPANLHRVLADLLGTGPKALRPGDAVVRKARPLHAGLSQGSADLIGWKTIEVTPDMVGQRIAVFASVEVKSERGRLRPEQVVWQEQTQAAGALSGVARSIPDAEAVLDPGRLLLRL